VTPFGPRFDCDYERGFAFDGVLFGVFGKVGKPARFTIGSEDDVYGPVSRDEVEGVITGPVLHRCSGKPRASVIGCIGWPRDRRTLRPDVSRFA
jgi:hypothetical protein